MARSFYLPRSALRDWARVLCAAVALAVFAVDVVTAAPALLAVSARRVAIAENIDIGETVGKIRFLGMLELPRVSINEQKLAQLSGLAWHEKTGVLYALSDKGAIFHLHPIFQDDTLIDVKVSRAVPLRDLRTGKPLRDRYADAEGLDLLEHPGNPHKDVELIVSFERFPRVMRYHTDGYAIGEYTLPASLAEPKAYASANRMLESVCYDSRFGMLTMPETPLRAETRGYNRLYSLSGRSWRYPVDSENRIVDLACLGNGEVLVLEGNFGNRFWRSHALLKRVRLNESVGRDIPIEVEPLLALESAKGYQIDNFEGIARHRGRRFFLVSDDNEFFLQRTLLLYFELLD